MPSSTVLISEPAVGAAQTLSWSCSCVFSPTASTASRTSAFSPAGARGGLVISHRQRLPRWSCGFNLQLAQLVGRFWVFFGDTTPGFVAVLFPSLNVDRPLGFAPEASLEDLGLPLWGPGVEVVQLLGSQGFWQHQGWLSQQEMQCSRRVWRPVLVNTL